VTTTLIEPISDGGFALPLPLPPPSTPASSLAELLELLELLDGVKA
jgi:hypothetical protein